MRLSDRFALDLTVELYASHRWESVPMQDLSRSGMFVSMATPLPLGTPVVVSFTLCGERVVNPGRVSHRLDADEARALSRMPGIGIEFREPHDPAFATAIEQLLRRVRTRQPEHSHVIVADAEPRTLERLSTALGDAGFSVATASTALEVFSNASRRTPDALLIDRDTPVLDGMRLIERIANDDTLAAVPVILMTRDASDMSPAFERGAADVILKPFSMQELIARARRVAQQPRRMEKMSLAGSLADLDLGVVLSMIEQQRKTGRIVLQNGHAGWIDIVDGRIVDAGWSADATHPRAIVLEMLGWKHGTFRLSTSPAKRRNVDLALPITHLLLEQARLSDEAARN